MLDKMRSASNDIRKSYAYMRHGKRINESLWYFALGPDDEFPNEITIHLSKTNIASGVAGAKDFIHEYRGGLRELARRMQVDPELLTIKQVVAASWIVNKNPGLLRRMGFTITAQDDEAQMGVAIMSRKDFLLKYGTEVESVTK
jgi:hypothetical protein